MSINELHESPGFDFDELVEVVQDAAQDLQSESAQLLQVMHFTCMERVYKRIAGFLDLSTELTGTMGQPAQVDPVLKDVEAALENTMIRVFGCYIKFPGPLYRPELMRTWAFADYLWRANQWDDQPVLVEKSRSSSK